MGTFCKDFLVTEFASNFLNKLLFIEFNMESR